MCVDKTDNSVCTGDSSSGSIRRISNSVLPPDGMRGKPKKIDWAKAQKTGLNNWEKRNFIKTLSDKYGLSCETIEAIWTSIYTDLNVYSSHAEHVKEFVKLYTEGKEA